MSILEYELIQRDALLILIIYKQAPEITFQVDLFEFRASNQFVIRSLTTIAMTNNDFESVLYIRGESDHSFPSVTYHLFDSPDQAADYKLKADFALNELRKLK